jgi:uncharacterized protein
MKITTPEQLEEIYHVKPTLASTAKVSDRLTPEYRKLVDASPFLILATAGEKGLDCSPRGDRGSAVKVVDDKTILLPDRRGNNRIDSLRNIVSDPRVALLFLIPGSGTTLRINGKAEIIADPDLLNSLAIEGHAPRTVTVIHIEAVYFQCARAINRSGLWNGPKTIEDIPTPGNILQALSDGEIDAVKYDSDWPERAAKSLW